MKPPLSRSPQALPFRAYPAHPSKILRLHRRFRTTILAPRALQIRMNKYPATRTKITVTVWRMAQSTMNLWRMFPRVKVKTIAVHPHWKKALQNNHLQSW